MSVSTPVAYNTGSPISGTTQIGNLAIGTTPQDYGSDFGGVKWWNGPDQNLGYVIAVPISGGNQPTPVFGVDASLGFYRSDSLTTGSFINLVNSVFSQSFTSSVDANNWLSASGYWSSYGSGSGNVIGPYFLHYDYSPAVNNGWITFPNHNASTWNNDPNLVGTNGYAIYINPNDYNGNNNSAVLNTLLTGSGTLTLTQGSSSAVYAFSNPNGFANINYAGEFYWDNAFESAQLGTLNLISSASSNFNNIDQIFITIS